MAAPYVAKMVNYFKFIFVYMFKSMVLAEIRTIMYTSVIPSFTRKKWGLRGSKLYRHVFVMEFFYISCYLKMPCKLVANYTLFLF